MAPRRSLLNPCMVSADCCSGWLVFDLSPVLCEVQEQLISVLSVSHGGWLREVLPCACASCSADLRPLTQISEDYFLSNSLLSRILPANSSPLNPEFWSLSYQLSKTTVLCLESPSQLCWKLPLESNSGQVWSSPLSCPFSLRYFWPTFCPISENTVHMFLSSVLALTLGE